MMRRNEMGWSLEKLVAPKKIVTESRQNIHPQAALAPMGISGFHASSTPFHAASLEQHRQCFTPVVVNDCE